MKRSRWRGIAGVSTVICFLLASPGSRGAGLDQPPVPERIPIRPEDAISGSEFARLTSDKSGLERQQAALKELEAGNLPESLRQLKPVRIDYDSPMGAHSDIVVWVMPDYLAIGSDDDSLRIPLSYPSATNIARRFGFMLPTRKLVDEIYDQAAIKLTPNPLPPGPRMRSSDYYLRHHRLIEKQLAGRCRSELVAGHKKDLVLTNRLRSFRNRVAVYGWHRVTGKPIQPLSTVHGARYADYSHGVRLVWAVASMDGRERSIVDLLADPRLAPALTYEGEIRDAGELLRWLPAE